MKVKFLNKFFSKGFFQHRVDAGFTLIELLIVIAILGVLAAGVLVAINPVQKINQANDANMKSNVGQIATALQAYYTSSSTQVYPAGTDMTGLNLLTPDELKVIPAAPAGYTYSYSTSGSGATAVAQVSFTLKAPAAPTTNNIWCWRSAVAQAVAQAAACTP